jgi:uncharacterized membrane protein
VTRVTKRRSAVVFLCASVVIAGVLVWILHKPSLYRITILPSLGGWRSAAYSLNDAGQVVGIEQMEDEKQRLFLWDRRSGAQDLGAVDEDPLIIDNHGRICGTMPDPNGPRAFVWEAGKGRTVLDMLGGAHSVALAMNNRGQIVGLSYHTNGIPRALVWDQAGGTKELNAPDGGHYWPQSINDAGQILATSIRVPAKFWRCFLIDSNGTTLLDGVPPSLEFRSVNNDSCVAGVDEPTGPRPRLVFRQRQGSPRYVTPVGIGASLTRLNDKGQIAYTSFCDRNWWQNLRERIRGPSRMPDEAVSFLWDPVRGPVPLNRYVRGMERFIVTDLNNNGAIVGSAETADGTRRAVLLEPIPERWGK